MTTATRKCAHCRNRFRRETMIINGVQAWCSEDHRIEWAIEAGRKLRANQAKEVKQQNKRELKSFRERDYAYQFQLTKKAAQRLANRLDAGLPCICCSEPRGRALFCGGHAKSAGAHPELALSLLNIHGQRNTLCNQHKSGNWGGDKHSHGYRQGLIGRYGQWIVDYLESYHHPRKYTCDELIAMRSKFNAEIRRLEKGLPPSEDWRSKELAMAQEQAA